MEEEAQGAKQRRGKKCIVSSLEIFKLSFLSSAHHSRSVNGLSLHEEEMCPYEISKTFKLWLSESLGQIPRQNE